MTRQPGSRYAFGFSAAALVLAAVGGVVVAISLRLIDDHQWVDHSQDVLTRIENIHALERAAISSQRGHLLIDDPGLRDEFWKAGTEAQFQIAALRKLVGNPDQQKRLALLQSKVDERLALAGRAIERHDREGLPAAQAYIRDNGGRELDEEIGTLVDSLRANHQRLLAERAANTERSARALLGTASLGIPLSLLILATVFVLLRREFDTRHRAELVAADYNRSLTESVSQLEQLSGGMERLSNYSGMLQSCSDAGEVLDITRQSLAGLLPGLGGTVYLRRAGSEQAVEALSWGDHRAPSSGLPGAADCWALRRSQPFFTESVHSDVKCAHVEAPASGQAAATACLPLSAHGESLGLLYLSGPGPGPLPGMELAVTAAEQLSLALANLRLRESLRQQSIRDPLTGLFNRRYLEESLARELARASRRQKPLAVLMLDVDHFKAFNDRHGHPGGDALLAAFGQLLLEHSRAEDIPCRFGGEEFTLILPEMGRADAIARAEAIRAAAEALLVRHKDEALSRVTVSIGLAVFPGDGSAARPLVEAADQALYRAKSGGRNRVVAASADEAPADF